MTNQQRSKTNSGFIDFLENIIRRHPLVYFFARSIVRYTNIFEEDANGIKYLNFKNPLNIIDVGASDGIATNFFIKNLKVNKVICYEPNKSYVNILKTLNRKKIIVKPYAIGDKRITKVIYFPRYNFLSKKLDLIPYTYYDKKKLIKQVNLDFNFRKNIKIVKDKLKIKGAGKINSDIDLIKIDVNDNGLSVLKELSNVIKKCKPALLIETDSEIKKIEKHLKKYRYGKYYFSNSKKQFFKIKKQYPLNTYFLQTRHLN